MICDSYVAWFCREGISATGIGPSDFEGWVRTASDSELTAIEAVLLGDFERRQSIPRLIKERAGAAIIALNDEKSLQETLDLFAAGVDDVVRKPVHISELLARIRAINNRMHDIKADGTVIGRIKVYFNGKDPEIDGATLPLPRRERRILEFLARNPGKLVTKTQIFNTIYGIFEKDVDENVIESHVSKLRKRLRHKLGSDPIESKRYLGYRLRAE